LDKELTKGQQEKAKKFFKTMKQCFDDPEECRCGEIEIKPFGEKCSVIAPLAAKCDSGDDSACEEMDEYEREHDPFDDLPDYLRDVLHRLEGDYDHDRIGNFMPPECEKEGATSPKECMKIMFRIHAPDECQEALERGEIDTSNEREAREACDRIMFEEHAPDECREVGLTDHEECGRFMFEKHAPQECLDAGLDGSSKGDHRKCEEIAGGMRDDHGKEFGSRGPGPDCRRIEDAEERLDCYDGKIEHYEGERKEFDYSRGEPVGGWPEECRKVGAFEEEACKRHMRERGEWEKSDAEERGRWEEEDKRRRGEEKICAEKCRAEGRPWDYYGGECVCKDERFGDEGHGPDFGRPDDRGDYEESECKDGCHQECPGASRTDCVDGGRKCACYYEDDSSDDFGGGDSGGFDGSGGSESGGESEDPGGSDGRGDDSGSGSGGDDSSSGGSGGGDSGSSGGDSGGDGGGSDDGGSDDSPGEDPGGSDGGDSGFTGGVIIDPDDDFFDYYFRK
jgi:hypothetical protein